MCKISALAQKNKFWKISIQRSITWKKKKKKRLQEYRYGRKQYRLFEARLMIKGQTKKIIKGQSSNGS